MEENKKLKQGIVTATGVLAIILIIGITVYRAKNSKPSEEANVQQPENIEYNLMTGPELKSRMTKQDIRLIDVRSVGEFGLEHIVDSVNIPLADLQNSSSIDTNRELVLVGPSNTDDLKSALSILKNKTSKKIFILQGGFVDWKAIGGTTVTWGDLTSFTDQSKTSFITMEEFLKKLEEKDSNITLVDARRNILYSEGHITGAINIPLSEIEERRDEFSSFKEIIFYADDEVESFQAAIRLYDAKLIPSKVLRGGLNEWKKRGQEVVR